MTGPFDGSPSKGNRWKEAQHWPPLYKEKVFYLAENGTLSLNNQKQKKEIDSFFYDPEVPIITQGGRNLFLESGPKDQRAIESRKDVLLYTSNPFDEDFEIGGPIKLVLYFSTSAHDTDIAVRMTDVYPDGRSILLTDATYRLTDKENPVSFIERNLPHEVEIHLESLAHVFAKGHSIRLSISSSNYPRFEKNLNIAAHKQEKIASKIATNRVHHGVATPSRLILPETP